MTDFKHHPACGMPEVVFIQHVNSAVEDSTFSIDWERCGWPDCDDVDKQITEMIERLEKVRDFVNAHGRPWIHCDLCRSYNHD
jgi:hypothetical protein